MMNLAVICNLHFWNKQHKSKFALINHLTYQIVPRSSTARVTDNLVNKLKKLKELTVKAYEVTDIRDRT